MPFAKAEPTLVEHIESIFATVEKTPERRTTESVGTGEEVRPDQSPSEKPSTGERQRAEGIIRDIGTEFNRLRKKGRSAAWADLEDKVAEAGHLLIKTQMITMKDWTGMLIDIEQFRKSEGGSEELPGDALAKWLSEPEKKVKAKSA